MNPWLVLIPVAVTFVLGLLGLYVNILINRTQTRFNEMTATTAYWDSLLKNSREEADRMRRERDECWRQRDGEVNYRRGKRNS